MQNFEIRPESQPWNVPYLHELEDGLLGLLPPQEDRDSGLVKVGGHKVNHLKRDTFLTHQEMGCGNPVSDAHLLALSGHGERGNGDVDLSRDEVSDDAGPGPVGVLLAVLVPVGGHDLVLKVHDLGQLHQEVHAVS